MTQIKDGFQNVAKSIRTSRDPVSHGHYVMRPPISLEELYAAYRTTWLAHRIVDIVPEDATREWRSWKAATSDITKIEDLEKTLQVQKKTKLAMIAARLTGGAALYMSVAGDEDRTEEPLNHDTVGKGRLRKLVVLGRQQLRADTQTINTDPDSPYYGEPELYTLHSGTGGKVVHQSRLIRFWGTDVPEDYHAATDGWADSVLEPIFDAVRDADSAMANLASLIYEAKTDVVKVKNLMSSMMNVPEYEATLIKRFQIAAMTKGTNGMLLLDEQDQWDQKQLSFGGLPDVVDRFFQWVSGASGIPVTRLFMRSPAGLNATGESDIRIYYDGVRNLQTNDIAPELDKLDRVMKASVLGGPSKDVFYEWNSLWQPTFDERAESSRKITEIGKLLAESNLVHPDAVAAAVSNTLVEIGAFSGLEQAIAEAGALPEPDEDEDETDISIGGGTDEGGSNVVPMRARDLAPRSLYISRPVKNAKAILDHYRAQGAEGLLPESELHVTIAFSRQPVDWAKCGDPWDSELRIPAGGMRVMEQFGAEAPYAQVLAFTSSSLGWRHEEVKDAGASWDHPEYQPHITIAYGDDMRKLEPYRGEIIFGPEKWEEVNEDWKAALIGDKFTPKTQPRHPKGSPKGGQFAPVGTGGGSAIMAALQAASSPKYGPDQIALLTQKNPKELSHYEKKVVAKYNKALKAAGAVPAAEPATTTTKSGLKISMEPPDDELEELEWSEEIEGSGIKLAAPMNSPALAVAGSVATSKYSAEAIVALAGKNPKELSHYEKKVVAKYNKALKATAAKEAPAAKEAAKEAAPTPVGKFGLTEAQNKTFEGALKKTAAAHYSMQPETLEKLVSGEWQPDPKKPWQAKAVAEAQKDLAAIKAGTFKPKAGPMSDHFMEGKHLEKTLTPYNSNQYLLVPRQELTSAELSSTKNYTGSAYTSINKRLRDGEPMTATDKAIQAGIMKHKLAKDATLVRGISAHNIEKFLGESVHTLQPGKIIEDKGFVSTTRQIGTAAGFAGRWAGTSNPGTFVVVRAKAGQSMMPVNSFSINKGEDEFLLPAGSAFKVTEVDVESLTVYVDLL